MQWYLYFWPIPILDCFLKLIQIPIHHIIPILGIFYGSCSESLNKIRNLKPGSKKGYNKWRRFGMIPCINYVILGFYKNKLCIHWWLKWKWENSWLFKEFTFKNCLNCWDKVRKVVMSQLRFIERSDSVLTLHA